MAVYKIISLKSITILYNEINNMIEENKEDLKYSSLFVISLFYELLCMLCYFADAKEDSENVKMTETKIKTFLKKYGHDLPNLNRFRDFRDFLSQGLFRELVKVFRNRYLAAFSDELKSCLIYFEVDDPNIDLYQLFNDLSELYTRMESEVLCRTSLNDSE